MKLETLLTIDVEELAGEFFMNRSEALISIVRETGARAVMLTGAYGRFAAFKDHAREQLAKLDISLI